MLLILVTSALHVCINTSGVDQISNHSVTQPRHTRLTLIMKLLNTLFIFIALISSAFAHESKKSCTKVKTLTAKGKYSISYVTTTTTLTQIDGAFTTTIYNDATTLTVKIPEYLETFIYTTTKTVTTDKVLSTSTVTVTDDSLTASYTTTLILKTASAIKTILLETSDSTSSFKIWTGLQLTLLLIGSFVFFI